VGIVVVDSEGRNGGHTVFRRAEWAEKRSPRERAWSLASAGNNQAQLRREWDRTRVRTLPATNQKSRGCMRETQLGDLNTTISIDKGDGEMERSHRRGKHRTEAQYLAVACNYLSAKRRAASCPIYPRKRVLRERTF
jgi:hypothetical protein